MDDLKPGRELDVLIAKKVMGFKNVQEGLVDEEGLEHIGGMYRETMVYSPHEDFPALIAEVPRFSTRIADAWIVVEKLHSDEWCMDMTSSEFLGEDMGGTDVTFSCKCGARGSFAAEAETAPHAICLAALKAVDTGS